MDLDKKLEILEIIEVPFSVLGKKYVLREASEARIVKWRGYLIEATEINSEGISPNLKQAAASSEPVLVALCTYSVEENGEKLPICPDTGDSNNPGIET